MEAKHTNNLVNDCLTIMTEKYDRIEGVEEIAEILGVTACHLIRTFKKEISIPPAKYLTMIRIMQAKKLLCTEDYTVEKIAQMVGYACGNYFCKVFRKEQGCSPLTYRNKFSAYAQKDKTSLDESANKHWV